MIDGYVDPEDLEKELLDITGEFSPPDGALLVAKHDGQIAGCVALQPLGDSA